MTTDLEIGSRAEHLTKSSLKRSKADLSPQRRGHGALLKRGPTALMDDEGL